MYVTRDGTKWKNVAPLTNNKTKQNKENENEKEEVEDDDDDENEYVWFNQTNHSTC